MAEDLVIDVTDLRKSFAGTLAVNKASLSVKSGDIFGFLGPNGSGKTTMLRMLCGLLTPDTGSGQCLGYDVLTESDKIRLQIGYMTQKFSLYDNLTIKENLDFAARLYRLKNRKQVVQENIVELGLVKRQNQLAGSLSGGWKQRLALSVALINKPKLLLLDEPTAGVDPQARRGFWECIHQLSTQGITTLVTTHYMDEAERCTHLAYMAYGNMLASGTRDEIISESGIHTWSGAGENLLEVESELRRNSEGVYISSFGYSIHVSSKDEEKIRRAVEAYPAYNWKKVPTSLEDVFTNLADQEDLR